MKTIKQIADELGLDKQKVYRYVRKNHISDAHQKGNVMYCDDVVETLIIQHFVNNKLHQKSHHEVHQTTSSDAVIDVVIAMLKTELDAKNKLIEEQQQTINKLTDTLASAQRTTQAEQLLHADTKGISVLPGPKAKLSRSDFWGRLFRLKIKDNPKE